MEMSQRALALLAKNVVWHSATGPKTLEQMSLNHIRACIKQGEECDELEEYCGLTRDEWRAVFKFEIERRTKSIELAAAKREVKFLEEEITGLDNSISKLQAQRAELEERLDDATLKLMLMD